MDRMAPRQTIGEAIVDLDREIHITITEMRELEMRLAQLYLSRSILLRDATEKKQKTVWQFWRPK